MQPLKAKNVSSKTRLRIISSKVRRRKTGEWPGNAAFAPALGKATDPVTPRLAGGSVFKIANAGKPDCYGFVTSTP